MIDLKETYTYEGARKDNSRGEFTRVTAQRKIKTGDEVKLTFLGASEEKISVEIYNPVWDTYDDISCMGENFYFEVVVNGKHTYYGKYAGYRYTEYSVVTGPACLFNPETDRTSIGEEQVRDAFEKFKEWLYYGAKDNTFWHGLYTKKDFPETISYCMPGEVVEPVLEKANGLTEGEELSVDNFNYKVLSAKEATVVLTGFAGELPEILEIPSHISCNGIELTVTEIGESAFERQENIKEITIPATITVIGEDAFRWCDNVQKFTSLAVKPPILGDKDDDEIQNPFHGIDRCDCLLFVPEKSVDKYRSNKKVLRGWSNFFNILPIGGEKLELRNDQLPSFDKTWKKVSFVGGKPKPKLEGIQNVWIEEGTVEIPESAFLCQQDLHSIYFPASVRRLGKSIFSWCSNLEHIYFEDPSNIVFESLEKMFYSCHHLSDLSFLKDWNVSSVKSMEEMFYECKMLNDLSPLETWKTHALEDTAEMFGRCEQITDLSPLSGWDMSSVKNAKEMFWDTKITDVDALSAWDTHSFESIEGFFLHCSNLIDISGLASWDTSKISNMSTAFLGCSSLKDYSALSSWKTGKVKDIHRMFDAYTNAETPVFPKFADWDTSKVEDMSGLFRDRSDVKDLNCLAGMDLSSVTTLSEMFSGCTALSDISALSTWSVGGIAHMDSLFSGCTALRDISPISGWDVSSCKTASSMFCGCSGITELSALKNWKWNSLGRLWTLFKKCTQLTNISALASWDIRRIESLYGLFEDCAMLADIYALASWDVSNVNDVSHLFDGCENLADLTPLRDWDTCLMKDFNSMFANCKNLTDVSPIAHWNMKRDEKNFRDLFEGCSKLTDVKCLDWRYGSAYIEGMFKDCGKSHYDMEHDYKAPKEPVEKQEPQCIDSFEIKEDADGRMEFVAGSIVFAMIPVEGGTYTMGYKSNNPNERYSYKNKAHEETVGDFFIGQTPVTQALWEAVMGSNPSQRQGLKLPVEWISFNDCMLFTQRLNEITGLQFTLPTQAEWEYAARGGKLTRGYKYAGSDDLNEVAWASGHTTHPVGVKKPNELGLYDMIGNISEMCLDTDDYHADSHINRGGCFNDSSEHGCNLHDYDISRKSNCVGLRLVLHKDVK